MASRLKSVWPKHLRQIQLITSDGSEGVIMIDVNQEIKWANTAALAMHGVACHTDLGRTIDEYHANFQIKFRGAPVPSTERSVESVASGETFRDVVIEVTPLRGTKPQWVYRVRNLVLVDEAGHPTCIVLVVHPLQPSGAAPGLCEAAIDDVAAPCVLMRLEDQKLIRVNSAFAELTGLTPERLAEEAPGGADVFVGVAALGHAGPGGGDAAGRLLATRPEATGGLTLPAMGVPVDYANQRCVLYTLGEKPVAPNPATAAPAPRAAAAAVCAASPTPLFAMDAEMRVLAASQTWLEWLGLSAEAVIGRPITEFMTSASAAHFEVHVWNGLAAHKTMRDQSCEFVSKTGAVIDALVSASAALDNDGNPALILAVPVDVTDRKKSEESFSGLFALSPVPMLIRKFDDGRILDVNDAFTAATGYSQADIVGHGLDELGVFDTRSGRQQFEAAIRTDQGLQGADARLKTSHGELLDCLLSARRIHAFGQTCVLVILQDISDRRRNETQLFQAIETVMEDTTWFSRSVIEKLATLRSPPRSGGRSAEIGDLTPREREVLGFISHGLSDVDIAQKLGLTRSTVRNHVATLYSKIGVHSRSSAIIWARERGINITWPAAPAANFGRANLPGKPAALALLAKVRRP